MDLKEAVLEEYALLEYATLNWCFHVRNTQTLDDNLKTEEIIFKRLMGAYDTNLVFQALIVWICSGAGRYALSSRLYPREHKQLLSGWILRHSEEITGYSLLHVIAHANLDNFLRWSIKSLEPDLIDVRDPQERTPLSHAASQGNTEIIMLLLERNVEVDSRDNCGRTPLSYAARDGHTEAIRLLLERNSEVNSKDGYGRTPLSYAARDGRTEAVRLLLERNSEVDWRDENGRTPLSYATNYGHTNAIQLLLERNSEVDSRDNDGQTPLFKSIYGEDLESPRHCTFALPGPLLLTAEISRLGVAGGGQRLCPQAPAVTLQLLLLLKHRPQPLLSLRLDLLCQLEHTDFLSKLLVLAIHIFYLQL
jgi:ankyrin repeat protein